MRVQEFISSREFNKRECGTSYQRAKLVKCATVCDFCHDFSLFKGGGENEKVGKKFEEVKRTSAGVFLF